MALKVFCEFSCLAQGSSGVEVESVQLFQSSCTYKTLPLQPAREDSPPRILRGFRGVLAAFSGFCSLKLLSYQIIRSLQGLCRATCRDWAFRRCAWNFHEGLGISGCPKHFQCLGEVKLTGCMGQFEHGGLEHTVTSPTAVNTALPSTIIPPPSYLSVAGLCALF